MEISQNADLQIKMVYLALMKGWSYYFASCLQMSCSATYNISATQIRVGTALIDAEFAALFDSGTSFTYLVDTVYSRLSENVSS